MKPNPEQDADRAAFEKYVYDNWGEHPDSDKPYFEAFWLCWQAAKADSRVLISDRNYAVSMLERKDERIKELEAMRDAFEQVCLEAEKVWQTDGLAEALLRAAPFRKTEV